MKRFLFACLFLITLANTAQADRPRHRPEPQRRDHCERYEHRYNYRYNYRYNDGPSRIFIVPTPRVYYYTPECPNPECNCRPCQCYPRCNCRDLRNLSVEEVAAPDQQCPNGKCPRPNTPPQAQEKPENEGDITEKSFVDRCYGSSVRLPRPESLGGSSTVIDCYQNKDKEWVAILIGCYHVVEERAEVRVQFFWPEKFDTTGYIVARDKRTDLSIVSCRVPKQVPYVGLARKSPVKGERVLTIGCPALDKNQSDPVGYFTTVTTNGSTTVNGRPRFEVNYPAIGGHSGGGVFKVYATCGVLVSRDPKESQVVPTEECVALYEKVFCEGDKRPSLNREDSASNFQRLDSSNTCIFDFFRRRQPRPPYAGPQGGAPDLRPLPPEPPPVVESPVVPEQPPVVVEDDEVNPAVVGFLIGIPAGLLVVVYMVFRKD